MVLSRAMEEKNYKVFVTVIVLVMSLLRVQSVEEVKKLSSYNFKAIYNFGDSNSDTGSGFAAFFPARPPSGETYFHRPAGRGSDGRLIIDFMGMVKSEAEQLGLPYLSGYLDSIGTNFRHGANFATGGATIRPQNEAWAPSGVSPFSLDIQIVQFDQFQARSSYFYNQAKWKRNLPRPEDFSSALYVFDIGMNDITAGFRKMKDRERHKSIPDIVEQLAKAVQHLYKGGARTFWIHNTGPYGCLAITLHYHLDPSKVDKQGCVKVQNDIAIEFNRQLKNKVIELRIELANASITYVDIYSAKYEMIGNAKQERFVDAKGICCGFHEDDIHVYCGHKENLNGTEIYVGSCEDPSKYISWDGVHYNEAANHWVATRILNGSFTDPPLSITHACRA